MKQTIFWLLGLFATSCSIQAIEVIDAGIYLSSNHFSNVIYWLDDDNLLVAGVPVERKPSDPSGTRLLRYRIANRSVTDMGQIGGGLCVSNGVVRFWRPTPETADKPLSQQKKVSLAGSLDNLVEVPPPPPLPPFSLPRDREPLHACQYPHELVPPPWLEEARKSGRLFKPLKPEHGWVEMVVHRREGVRPNPDYPAAILKPDGTRVPIPDVFRSHLREGFSLFPPKYIHVKDAYFVVLTYAHGSGGSSSRPAGIPLAWWLYPNGSVEEFQLRNPANWTWGTLIFTKVGNLWVRTRFGRAQASESGIYRDDISGPVKLVAGRVMMNQSVSPDGCLVAFGNDESFDLASGGGVFKLQVINACEGKLK